MHLRGMLSHVGLLSHDRMILGPNFLCYSPSLQDKQQQCSKYVQQGVPVVGILASNTVRDNRARKMKGILKKSSGETASTRQPPQHDSSDIEAGFCK